MELLTIRLSRSIQDMVCESVASISPVGSRCTSRQLLRDAPGKDSRPTLPIQTGPLIQLVLFAEELLI